MALLFRCLLCSQQMDNNMYLDSKNKLFENDMGSLHIQATIFHEHDLNGIHPN